MTIRATWSFGARPAPADGALDLLRRVGEAVDAALAGAQHRHPARLSDREGAAGVRAEVQALERHRNWLVLTHQRR